MILYKIDVVTIQFSLYFLGTVVSINCTTSKSGGNSAVSIYKHSTKFPAALQYSGVSHSISKKTNLDNTITLQ